MGGACSAQGEMRNTYISLARRPKGKRPLRRPRRRLEDNIKIDLREISFLGYGLDSYESCQNRDGWLALVNTVMNLRVP
jgi:hypothetical protein